MKNRVLIILLCLVLTSVAIAQRSRKSSRYFGNAVLTDSLSTIFFPVLYNEDLLSANKIALWVGIYTNLVVYDFNTDSYRRLFSTDTYIESFRSPTYRSVNEKITNITAKWIFLLVKPNDYNHNGRIDGDDPSVLYVTTTRGEELKALTDTTENVVSFEFFEKQRFGLIKIQRDSDTDFSFRNDSHFYFRKIDLNTLSLGKPIEVSD